MKYLCILITRFSTEKTSELMIVACLRSHWSDDGEADLLSFAAITDEPPPDIATASHDRCIILTHRLTPDFRGLWGR
ncbi:hypothetical protein FNZ07_23215 [Paraburkholderia megapolitana]|nr:hypothetical protein FNZ07_23215 [Paraburkholderia megapolitana]